MRGIPSRITPPPGLIPIRSVIGAGRDSARGLGASPLSDGVSTRRPVAGSRWIVMPPCGSARQMLPPSNTATMAQRPSGRCPDISALLHPIRDGRMLRAYCAAGRASTQIFVGRRWLLHPAGRNAELTSGRDLEHLRAEVVAVRRHVGLPEPRPHELHLVAGKMTRVRRRARVATTLIDGCAEARELADHGVRIARRCELIADVHWQPGFEAVPLGLVAEV